MFNRTKAIKELVQSDFDYIMSGDGADLLESYLEYGFIGYDTFTDEQIIVELEQRDISPLFGETE
jgi:hypothetical protein